MWPFDIFAKRRAAEEAKKRAEYVAHMDRVKASIEEANRRQLAAATAINQASLYRSSAAASAQRQAGLRAVAGGPSSSARSSTSNTASDIYTDPLNPSSPLNPINQASNWSAPAEEPRHAAPSHCADTSSNWSFSDHGSSHSHTSHDHGCSGSSYDSGSSSGGSFD